MALPIFRTPASCRLPVFGLIFSLAIILPAHRTQACAPVPPEGMTVRIKDESAIIVWDAEQRMQHFIRRASFRSEAEDFGFLVPTPSPPELAEASDGAFSMLEQIMRPGVVYSEQKGVRLTLLLLEAFLLGRHERVLASPPRVLSMKRVAGYDAAVLEAENASALNDWLQQHGYPASPELEAWFEPYIQKKWIITAFKVAGDTASGAPATGTVRMSFAADRPFFPYREPEADQVDGSRVLQVFILSSERMEGELEAADAEWPGNLSWADRIKPADQSALFEKLGMSPNSMPNGMWLNAFEDFSDPRPGRTDLFFRASEKQTPKVPPPIEITRDRRIPIPIDLLFLAVAGISAILWWRSAHRKEP